MTRIGVATHNWGMNFGGTLQGYALLKILEGFAWEARRIMYAPGREFPVRPPENGVRRFVREGVQRLAPFFDRGSRIRQQAVRRKTAAFDSFRHDFIRETPTFGRYQDVVQAAVDFDVAVAGSDQIWNPHYLPDTPFFMLGFVPPERRIAYAGSFGVGSLPAERIPFFREGLNRFAALSVREESGADLIETLLGKRPPVVLDPTLLLTPDRWDRIAETADPRLLTDPASYRRKTPPDQDYPVFEKDFSSPYILCYALNHLDDTLVWAEKIRERTGLETVSFCLSRSDFEKRKRTPNVRFMTDAGPAEFVALFKNARFVVTNSFHGTAFSVLYRKPFVSVRSDLDGALNKTDSRKADFLRRIGLDFRFVSPTDPLTDRLLDADFDSVEKILVRQRAFSLDFLKTSVETALSANSGEGNCHCARGDTGL